MKWKERRRGHDNRGDAEVGPCHTLRGPGRPEQEANNMDLYVASWTLSEASRGHKPFPTPAPQCKP